ncbi:hypothetical protein [Streptomyces noursei]|uniref:hypothetical protein n=1 Tax=Streptomyces noursei TaxID=1971 RepID=UPI0022796D0C|nr:hypothetical protein [Streptomyces noursei]
MADDRYSWLDKDAAERLLRGEPAGSQVGDGAPELEHLLKAAAAAGSGLPESAPLPGEEAALAAFRNARHGPGARGDTARGAALPGVRVDRTRRVAERGGLARPFRRGFAVALAVCAIGGIAVAAGTGVLPTPFRGGEPQPGASVSAAETPSTFETQEPATTGETGRTPATPPDGRPTGPGASPSPGGSPGTVPTPGTPTPGTGTGTPGGGGWPQQDGDGKGKKRLLLALCKDYETGKRGDMDRDTLRRLESKAGGPDRVHAFCRQYLAQSGQQGGGSGDNDGGGGKGGNGGGQGENGGNGGGGHNGGGSGDEEGDSSPTATPSPSAPPASTTPAPDPSTTAPTPTGTLPAGRV